MRKRATDEKLNVEIGSYIKERREALGLTQVALGRKLGYKYGNYIAMLEAGNAAFPFERWMDYADVLEVPRHKFLELVLYEKFPDVLDYIIGFQSIEEKRESDLRRIRAGLSQDRSPDEKREDKEEGIPAELKRRRQKDKIL